MTLVFTICSNNYLAQAITLGNSLLAHNPDYDFKIGLVDKLNPLTDYSKVPFEIVEVESIGIDNFDELVLRYSIIELNTAVKPFFFNHFFEISKEDTSLIYLDPDIYVFQPFIELEQSLITSDIVLTPHFSNPVNDGKKLSEEDILNTGLYNLGFLALKKSENGRRLIAWWGDRLINKAFIDFKRGLFTDQIWLNFAPLFFEKVSILDDPGYNMAYWNLHERVLSKKDGTYLVNKKVPLVFFHFSGYSPGNENCISKYQDRYSFSKRPDIAAIFTAYSKGLKANGFEFFVNIPCFYKDIKVKHDARIRKEKIDAIPVYKKIIRSIILRIIRLFDIPLDYSKL